MLALGVKSMISFSLRLCFVSETFDGKCERKEIERKSIRKKKKMKEKKNRFKVNKLFYILV